MADSQRKTANLFDGVIEQGSYETTVTPISKIESQWRCRTSTLIDVSENLNYSVSLLGADNDIFCVVHFLNSAKGKISEVGWSSAPFSFTTPSGCHYIDVIFKKEATSVITPSSCGLLMVNEGSTLPYEPYWQHSLRKLTTATEAVENPLYSDGTAITAYTIKGNTVQDGTPTPSNPVDVNGVGVMTENLLDMEAATDSVYINSSGTITYNDAWSVSDYISVESLTSYTISRITDQPTTAACHAFYDANKSLISTIQAEVSTQTFETPTNAKYIRCSWRSATIQQVMLNTGSTAKPYEPYGYKIPISAGGVTTNIYLSEPLRRIGDYADTIAADGTVTRVIKTYKITGQENWGVHGSIASWFFADNIVYPIIPTDITLTSPTITSHFKVIAYANATSISNGECTFGHPSGILTQFRTILKNTDYTTVEDFTDWLKAQYNNGNPVTIWYASDTPTTETTTAPSIPTTEGANSITVDTTVQPSVFTATWSGWHDASVKEKSENYLDENDFGLVEVAAETYRVGTDVGVLSSGKYTFNAVKSSSAVQIYRTTKNGSTYNYEAISELPYTFTADGVSNQIFRSAGNTGSSWADLGYTNVMLNTGETAQTYEPYWK